MSSVLFSPTEGTVLNGEGEDEGGGRWERGPSLPFPVGGSETTMHFWTLPGAEGTLLEGAVELVETSLTMGHMLGTAVVTGEVVVDPEPEAEVLRDKICCVEEALEDDDLTKNLVRGGKG